MASHGHAVAEDTRRLSPEQGKKLLTYAGAIAAVGILLALGAAFTDGNRFAYSYLVGFEFTVTIGLGGMVLVLIQHLTRSGWSIATRRSMEWLAGFLPVAAILFIPIALNLLTSEHGLYHEWSHPSAEEAEMVHKKAAYLNPSFFLLRAVVFFAIWSAVSWFYRSNSLKQDESGDPALTSKMQKFGPPLMFAIAYSLGFSGIDWVMSMKPAWFSTMFAVYIFAGAMTSALATLALIMVTFRAKGLLNRVFTEEHQHDLGKLLFAFTVFFAYIGFCQFFLIWYGNISEETNFYHERFIEGWKGLSWTLPLFHFGLPFLLLLPRTMKRSMTWLRVGAVIMLVMHYLDMYWLVMPNLDEEGMHLTWIDLAGLMAPVGVLCVWLAYRASKDPIYPLKDPRIPETLRVDNGQG